MDILTGVTFISADGTQTTEERTVTIPDENIYHKSEIITRLAEIDTEETRPLAAITLANLTGVTPNSFDVAKLSEFEAEKVELRAELATL